jgi:hypothetical protein
MKNKINPILIFTRKSSFSKGTEESFSKSFWVECSRQHSSNPDNNEDYNQYNFVDIHPDFTWPRFVHRLLISIVKAVSNGGKLFCSAHKSTSRIDTDFKNHDFLRTIDNV